MESITKIFLIVIPLVSLFILGLIYFGPDGALDKLKGSAESLKDYVPDVSMGTDQLTAKEAGVSGIVCSPQEVKILRSFSEFKDLKIVVPGVRSYGFEMNDQNRVSTPAEAIANGADYLVIGRQITKAKNSEIEIQKLCEEIRKYKNI